MKIIFITLSLIFINSFLASFNFGIKEASYLKSCDKKFFLWHLSIPFVGLISNEKKTLDRQAEILLFDLAKKMGAGSKIAILDTDVYNENSFLCNPTSKTSPLSQHQLSGAKFEKRRSLLNSDTNDYLCEIRLAEQVKKNQNIINSNKKKLSLNHGDVTREIIKQLAPLCEIIVIPIMDKSGFASKQSLLDGLQKAIDIKVDVVHLGLKCQTDMNIKCQLDKQINKLIKKIPYVVASAGNDGKKIKQLAYPAALKSIFFSVGAFEYKDNSYPLCDFSQGSLNSAPNFLFPGLQIAIPIFDTQAQNYLVPYFSGTSMAAAMMTGFLALVLSEFKNDFNKKQIREVILSSSKKLKKNWDEKVNFGMVDCRETLMKLLILKGLFYKTSFIKKLEMINKFFTKEANSFYEVYKLGNPNKNNVKKTTVYATCEFYKKIDRDLYILVKDNIYALKERIWEEKQYS
ncbi:MAG: S8/S53 family peptidase [Candidatus Dependentiae bacterium]|nr:S8/S53 family peptidase [Candidatus Dependentiae bacterium]